MNTPGLPTFRLRDADGNLAGPADLLQQQDMVVALLHDPSCQMCSAFLDELARQQAVMQARGAAAIAVIMGPGTRPLPIRQLLDVDGHATALIAWALSLTPGDATVLVADRYGGVYARLPVHGVEPAATLGEATDWLDFIGMQCDECGVSEW